LAEKLKEEAQAKVEELERRKKDQMSLQIVKVLDSLIKQTKEAVPAAEKRSKDLKETAGRDGFCLQESKAHRRMDVTIVHSKIITEEMKKNLPAIVM